MARRKCEIPRNFQRTPIGVRPDRTKHEHKERNREQGKLNEHLSLSQVIWNEFKMDRKANLTYRETVIENGKHIPNLR